ncbi:hypothetical protein ACFCQI_09420 [Rhodanobacter sp. FW102-FHT14D06]|uniref:Uncharacterized protein n=2 Tax=unclassified Rhodanobacter TaxID=2621553 RepID=A0AB74UTC5_9GAMM
MKITPVTTAAAVRKRLLKLIDECKSFHWATAWASESDVLDAALASDKMTFMVIGTHQYFTAPEVLDQCLDIHEVRVMHPNGGSTPIPRTLSLSPILGQRSVHVQAQALQP